MIQLLTKHKFRRFLLRCSSLQLASILMASIALLYAGSWLEQSVPWWLILLSGLLALVLLCVALRVVPVVWRDMVYFRNISRLERMPAMQNYVSWQIKQTPQELAARCRTVLAQQAYGVLQEQTNGMTMISAMKGKLNRLGFILIHLAGMVILLGALLDSDLWLRYQIWSGKLSPVSRSMPTNEMSVESTIGARSGLAFQGSGHLLPGQISDELKVSTEQGELVKHLPYAVVVNAVELNTEQLLLENNFLTHIAVLDPRLDKPVTAVLGINRPFRYRGLNYYQQAIADGGSELTVTMWPLTHARATPLKFRSQVKAERRLQTRLGTISIVFSDLNPRNVMNMQTEPTASPEFKNIGPSLYYSISDELSREREFINYMLPVLQNGRYFFISGVKESDAASFRFLHIPIDQNGGPELFLELHAALHDQIKVDKAIQKVLRDAGKTAKSAEHKALQTTMAELVALFRQGGFRTLDESIGRRVDKVNYQQSSELSYKLVRSLLYALYIELDDHGRQAGEQIDESALLFFEDAILALSGLAEIDAPFYIQLEDIDYKPLVKLLVSYKPGEPLVFIGWFILLSGMLASFYSYHRRIWLVLKNDEAGTLVSMAGMSSRHRKQFADEFAGLFAQLQKQLEP